MLRWPADPDADAYIVRVQGRDLRAMRTITLSSTTLVLGAATMDTLLEWGASAWSVNPVIEGDEYGSAGPALLPQRP